MVNAIHRFTDETQFVMTEETPQNTNPKGTPWAELFIAFDVQGYNPEQTIENDKVQQLKQQSSPSQMQRQQRWIQHRLINKQFAKQGLQKPLATAEKRGT